MTEYHKIQSLFKRDEKTRRFIIGQWSLPVLEYLANATWEFTEKLDGTNVRIIIRPDDRLAEGPKIEYRGRTDKAVMPDELVKRLNEIDGGKLASFNNGAVLYGEGVGPKIQKGGGNYGPSVDFVLFDVRIRNHWLSRENVKSVADALGIKHAPIIGRGSLYDAIKLVTPGFDSQWGPFIAEGIVARPVVELYDAKGNRVITKVKHKDFI